MQNIEYNDIDSLKSLVVGHRIVKADKGVRGDWVPDSYDGGLPAIRYELDNGAAFVASDTDGGCACSNGCFEITASETLPESVITDVEQIEESDSEWSESANIRLFVYSAGIKTELFHSYGGDNGYYGWGHNIYVEAV